MRLKVFQVDQRLEMLRVPLVTIFGREMRLKICWSRPNLGDVASGASHDIGARNAIENFSSRPSFGDVASAASHDIGARNAIESFFNYIWCQTANNVTSSARKISLHKLQFVNRCQFSIAYIAPISWLAVLAAPPRLVLLKNFQSQFSRQLRDLRHSHHTVSEDCRFQSHTPHQYRDKSVLARNRM